jgi:hypothetical protein
VLARVALAILVAVGCDEAPRPVARRACTMPPPEEWLDGARGELGLSRELVATVDRGTVIAAPIGGEPARWPLADALAVYALEPIGGDHHALIAYGACEADPSIAGARAPCLVASAMDARGRPVGSPVRAPFVAAARTLKRASAGGRAYLAWSTDEGERALDSFRIVDGTLAHVRHELGTEPATRELPVEILGLAASGSSWAVIWRRGPIEADGSEVFVTTRAAHAHVEAIHEALAIEAMRIEGERVGAIAAFEFSRPHLIELSGGEVRRASELTAAAIPQGFRARAELDRDAEGLWLRRRTAAGDPIGERERVAGPSASGARIAGDGRRLVVAWREGDRILGRRIACR